ncbi:MAG: acyl-CoA synthetase [Chloroflexi bacterium]|nr:acyl-CoA synthetase [Chloroflexota bacterium]
MEFNLADLLECVTDAVPDREALICGERRLTFAQLDERANRLAHYLSARGIGEGDHVGIYMHNGTEYVETSLAAFKIRAIPININYRYVEEELLYLFDNADLVALVHHREFAPRIEAVVPKIPNLKTFIVLEDGSGADCSAFGSEDYDEALKASSPERGFPTRSGADLYILYTGGTTGMPKGVMWQHEDLFFAALMGGNPYGPQPERPEQVGVNAATPGVVTMLPAAPLMHGAAQWATLIGLLGGGKIVISQSKKFDPDLIWKLVEQEKVNTIAIVGDAMARPLAEALAKPGASYDTSSLRVVGSGGATYSEGVKAQLREQLPTTIFMDSFGGSEGGNQGQGVDSDTPGTAPGPRFRADGTTAVLDENMKPLEPGCGVIGMLARKGRIPLGYYKDPVKTAETFVEADGVRWVISGDMAAIEADGTITLLGRGSNCINSGGEKIFPEEVESALRSHPGVFDAIVVGVSDERWGERVTAVVHPRSDTELTLEELVAHCRTKVAGYKVPRELHLVDEIVRQPSGKPDYKWAKRVATGGEAVAAGKDTGTS